MGKCWYCNEELTTANYCDEHIGICTKCYSLMFKVGNDFVKGLTDKITDLKEDLADAEEHLEDLEVQLREQYQIVDKQDRKIKKLKQQLAEKEKQIKKLNYEAQKYYEDAYCNDFHEKDKISFAVKQLEKVKNRMKEDFDYDDLMYWLDKQIKKLKGD